MLSSLLECDIRKGFYTPTPLGLRMSYHSLPTATPPRFPPKTMCRADPARLPCHDEHGERGVGVRQVPAGRTARSTVPLMCAIRSHMLPDAGALSLSLRLLLETPMPHSAHIASPFPLFFSSIWLLRTCLNRRRHSSFLARFQPHIFVYKQTYCCHK